MKYEFVAHWTDLEAPGKVIQGRTVSHKAISEHEHLAYSALLCPIMFYVVQTYIAKSHFTKSQLSNQSKHLAEDPHCHQILKTHSKPSVIDYLITPYFVNPT